MGRKPKISAEQKKWAVLEVLEKGRSKRSVIRELQGRSGDTGKLNYWIARYQMYGEDGLVTKPNNERYSEERVAEVLAFVRQGNSVRSASVRFCIPLNVVFRWLKRDECHTIPNRKADTGMAGKRGGKGVRKTFTDTKTKLLAVQECIASGYDYSGVCGKYGVKYGALYSWVRAFEKEGAKGLEPHRRGETGQEPLSELDRLRAENEALKARLRIDEETIEVLKNNSYLIFFYLFTVYLTDTSS